MKQYLLSTYQPDTLPPASVDIDEIMRDVAALEQEMKAAGVWVFNNHLHPASSTTVVRVDRGNVLTTDGPYAEGKEHIGGISIINAPDLDAALEWAGKMARATTLPIEVRPFQEVVPAFVELESGGPLPVACRVVGVGQPPSHPTKEGDRREQHLPEDQPPCPA